MWGRAEADTNIRVFFDRNNNGVIDLLTDTFLGQTVAVPFAEFLVGFTHTSRDIGDVGVGSTEFTIQPGGGVDLGNERVAARLSFAWRRVFYEGTPTNMFRFVGGVVIRR